MAEPAKSFEDEFLRGQRDCMNGLPHKSDQGEDYDRGYAAQYEHEQVQTEISLRASQTRKIRWD